MSSLRAPFSGFGGKADVAHHVWAGLGNVSHYVEAFTGTAAVLLARPHTAGPRGHPFTETINDIDGLLVNFWRAMALRPDEVIKHSKWPVLELDLHARHRWLVGERENITERLRVDPDWCDPKAAGWWVWGTSAWIGSGWGARLSQQMPSVGRRGVHSYSGEDRLWACAKRLSGVRVLCGDWKRALAPSGVEKWRNGPVGVFLDPPYGVGKIEYAGGGNGDFTLVEEVWAWAERMEVFDHVRVCIAGYEGHPCLPGWRELAWDTGCSARGGGYSNSGTGEAKANCRRERLWFSPSCDLVGVSARGGGGTSQLGLF